MRYGSDGNRPSPSRSERSSGQESILTGLEYSLCGLRCRGFDIQVVLSTPVESVKENMDWLKGTVR